LVKKGRCSFECQVNRSFVLSFLFDESECVTGLFTFFEILIPV
jgi:hypothetical protein